VSSPVPRDASGAPGDASGAPQGAAGAPDGWLELDAPAKINLYLRVLGRREDGYHELVTVLQTVELCDTLRLRLRARAPDAPPGGPDVRLALDSGPAPDARDVPAGADNLVVRAALALLAQAGATGDVGLDLALHKRIPAGGGLGGGSSDAAAALHGLNLLLGAPCESATLQRLAGRLGSDVPFFLHGGTALCTGRGERVEPIAAPAPFPLTLYVPPFGTRTPDVYAALSAGPVVPAAPSELRALREAIAGADAARLHALHRNDLQRAASTVQPALAAWLSQSDVHLSGSGSTLFRFGHAPARESGECRAILICSRPAWRKA
jgi:4-diphosphocytidyl-2-C-methyl-D-erythritol kinase